MRAPLLAAVAVSLITLPTFAAITGTVMTKDGQPIAGAKVSLFAPESAEARRARYLSKAPDRVAVTSVQTDSKGLYKLDTPKDPVVELRIEAKGYAPDSLRVMAEDDAGAIALAAAPAKQGTITAGGKAVAGATVIWGGSAEVVSTTDAAGHYSVPDPEKWAIRVVVVHPDYAVLEDSNRLDNRKKGPDRTLDAGVALSGRVVAADGQTPAAKAAVSVDVWPLATTADDGTFSIPHAAKKWETVEARSGDRIGVRARGSAGPVTVKLAPAASLSGSLRDAKSRPLVGAEVQLLEGGFRFGGSTRYSTTTDAKGNYSLPMVRPGSYQVNGVHPGYAIVGGPVSLSAGQRGQKTLSGTEYARISGSVVDEDKRPVAAAAVSARAISRDPMAFMMMMRGGQQNGDGLSGPDGRFVVRTAGDTDLQLHGTKKGWPEAKSSSFRVATGERKGSVVLTIPRGMAVTGTVADRNGKPLSGVTVISSEAESGLGGMRRFTMNFGGRNSSDEEDQVRTGSDGKFSLRLKEGTYDLGFKREGYAAKAVRAFHVAADARPVEVTLDPGVEITGRVVRGGAGVEGVNVGSVSSDSQAFATTGPDGTFTLSDLTPGSMMVNFNKMDDYIQEMRTISAPARDVVVTLPAGGKVTGHVVDKSTHQPVTSFQAGISPSRSGGGMVFQMPPMMHTFTSDDGSFTMENVPPGAVQLVASAPGYTTGRVSGLNLEEGKSLSNVEIALETGVKLVGHVTGPDGAPVNGATIRPDAGRGMRMPGMPGESVGITDTSGDYTIESMEPGQKTFQVSHPNYVASSKTVELTGRETRMDVQLSSGQRVSGVVVNEAGAPVAEAQVFASSAGGSGGRSAQSDANGAFQFDSLAAGRYNFNASKQGYAEGVVRDFDIASGGQVRVTLKTGGSIYGHISGLTEAELGHTSVSARGPNGNSNASVDAGGNYRLEGAPTGTVRVVAEMMTGFTERRSSEMKSVQIEPGSSMQVDLEFRNDTTVTGRITRNGQALPNAMVSFNPRNPTAQTSAQATTDDSGSYKVAGLADGAYSVTVMDMGRLSPHSDTYEVHGSGRYDIDIKSATVRGRVSDAGSNGPISEARISLRPNGPAGGPAAFMMGARATVTDPNGNFVLDNVSLGNYTVTAEKDNYGNDVKDVTVGDSTPELDLRLSTNDALTLSVVDARDQHLLNAMVMVYDSGGRVVNDGSDGMMRFGGAPQTVNLHLAPGQYRAVVFAMGYATSSVTVTAPGKQTVGVTPGGTIVVQSKATDRRVGRLVDAAGQPYQRGPFMRDGNFGLEASPGATTLQNVAPGTYTLQVLQKGAVVGQTTVTVIEGQTAQTEL